jgi:hypothetical protein
MPSFDRLRLFIFPDEAGCFNFSRNLSASRYYIVRVVFLIWAQVCGTWALTQVAVQKKLRPSKKYDARKDGAVP